MKLLVFILPLLTWACHPYPKIIEPKPIPENTNTLCENGTLAKLKKIQLDGCTWILELPSGEQLEPVNYRDYILDEEVKKQEPIQVKVVYTETRTMSICMIGKTVAISCLERLK